MLNEKLEQLKILLTWVDELMPEIKKDLKHGENNLLNQLYVIQRDPTYKFVMKPHRSYYR